MHVQFLCGPQDVNSPECVCGCENMWAVPFSRPSARVSSSWGDGLSLQGSLGTFRNVGEMDWERLLLLLWLLPAAVPRGVCVSMLRELALRWQRGGGARCPSGASLGWPEEKVQRSYTTEHRNKTSVTHTLSVFRDAVRTPDYVTVFLQHSCQAHSQ